VKRGMGEMLGLEEGERQMLGLEEGERPNERS
jgi:hypothetical protein